MSSPSLSYLIKELERLNEELPDRREFHKAAKPILEHFAEPMIIHQVFEQNLRDKGFLHRSWSTYEIPFLYIAEFPDFYLKYHVFPPVASKQTEHAANIIHHHNNYLLTSLTVQGAGYHTLQFDRVHDVQDQSKVMHRISKDYFHGHKAFSFVDSYEPHLVFNMAELTTTLVLWSPDQKRKTDRLRNSPLLKKFKKPIIAMIHALGLGRKIGVADNDVFQWYVHGGKLHAVSESDYFDMYKAVTGPEVDDMNIQAVCLFAQKAGYANKELLQSMINNPNTPESWRKWLEMLNKHEQIPEVYGKERINIPGGKMTLQEVREVCGKL